MDHDNTPDLITTLQGLSLLGGPSCRCNGIDPTSPTTAEACPRPLEAPLSTSPESVSSGSRSESCYSSTATTPAACDVPASVAALSSCASTPANTKVPSTTSTMPSSTSSTSSTSTPIAKPKPTITAPTKISTYKVRLDITSDSTCPWCFITKRRISKAIAMFHSLSEEASRVRFDIHWHPYQLDPRAPKEPIPKSKLYTRKFGPERAVLVRDRVMAVGKLEGIEFLKAEDCWYCSTIDSHRLIRYARHKMGRTLFDTSSLINNKNSNPTTIINRDLCDNKDKDKDTDADSGIHSDLDDPEDEDMDVFGNMMEDAMVDELFQSHFERGETGDLASLKRSARLVLQQFADIENARSAAAASGNQDPIVVVDDEAINKEMAEIEQYMDSDQGLAEVKEEIRVAKQDMGFQGVPSIIVQNTYLLSGGQDSTVFVEIFKRVV